MRSAGFLYRANEVMDLKVWTIVAEKIKSGAGVRWLSGESWADQLSSWYNAWLMFLKRAH